MVACSGLEELKEETNKKKEKEKPAQTLIPFERTVTPPPPAPRPPRSFFFSAQRLPPLYPTAPFSLPLPVSFPLSSSRGASAELAVVSRLMDGSESGTGWGGGQEQTGRQGRRAPCNHFMDMCCAKWTQTPRAHKGLYTLCVCECVCS